MTDQLSDEGKGKVKKERLIPVYICQVTFRESLDFFIKLPKQ